MFRHIERSDGTFMWLCLVYLMLIAFLPVPSGTLGHYGDEFSAVIFFAVTLLLVALMELIIWQYASHNRRLLRPEVTDSEIQLTRWRTYNVIIVVGISIFIAFVSPLLAMLSWMLMFFTRRLITRRFDRMVNKTVVSKTS